MPGGDALCLAAEAAKQGAPQRRKGAAPSPTEIQDAARADALRAVGVSSDLHPVVGMQVRDAGACLRWHSDPAA